MTKKHRKLSEQEMFELEESQTILRNLKGNIDDPVYNDKLIKLLKSIVTELTNPVDHNDPIISIEETEFMHKRSLA